MYGHPPPPPYAMLNGGNQYYANNPYNYHPNAPQYYPNHHHKRKSGCGRSCCRCICCCCCFLLLLILIQLLAIFYLYHVYDPKLPSYNVESVAVRAFSMKPDFGVNADLQMNVRAENPNKKIGFVYGTDSWVGVDYSDANLAAGKLPSFQQGHENTTVFPVELKGRSEFGPGLQHALKENQKNHSIPLLVKMKVPVRVVLGEIPLREFKVFVNCSIVLDSLSPNKTTRIVSRETAFRIEI